MIYKDSPWAKHCEKLFVESIDFGGKSYDIYDFANGTITIQFGNGLNDFYGAIFGVYNPVPPDLLALLKLKGYDI